MSKSATTHTSMRWMSWHAWLPLCPRAVATCSVTTKSSVLAIMHRNFHTCIQIEHQKGERSQGKRRKNK